MDFELREDQELFVKGVRDFARGEIEPAKALLDQQYSIEGDSAILLRFGEWFPGRDEKSR